MLLTMLSVQKIFDIPRQTVSKHFKADRHLWRLWPPRQQQHLGRAGSGFKTDPPPTLWPKFAKSPWNEIDDRGNSLEYNLSPSNDVSPTL